MRKALLLLLLCLLAAPALAQQAPSGSSPKTYITTSSTNCTLVVAGAHTLTGLEPQNTTATIYYLKVFDKATAPVAGTDTPIMNIVLPATSAPSLPLGNGVAFRLGVGFCVTGAIALLDNTNAATGITVNLDVQ